MVYKEISKFKKSTADYIIKTDFLSVSKEINDSESKHQWTNLKLYSGNFSAKEEILVGRIMGSFMLLSKPNLAYQKILMHYLP